MQSCFLQQTSHFYIDVIFFYDNPEDFNSVPSFSNVHLVSYYLFYAQK